MPDPGIDTVAGVLERLVAASGCALAGVALRQHDHFLIEECFPQRCPPGARLPIPAGLDAVATEESLATAPIRLPLDWTIASGSRPDYIASRALGQDDRCLILAGKGRPPPGAILDFAADRLAAALSAGQGTQRELALALQVRDLVDHLPFPVVFINSRSFDALVNDPARALLALPAGAAGNANVHLALHAIMAGAGVAADIAFSAGQTDHTFDLMLGEHLHEVTIRSIERERLAGRLWVFRNVTAEREAARFKDELIANVSHELRTPLTSIVGALSLLKGLFAAAGGPDAVRLLTIADSNAARLARLVDDLLDAGRIEAGHLEIAPRPVDLGWLVADTIELNRPYADRLGIAVAFSRPRRRHAVLVDPERMAQVIGNVLSNAAKFSPPGSTVTVTIEAAEGVGRVRIADQGCGMTPEFQQRLFSRFVQARNETGRMPGTGLGLSIAKGIVEAMGGSIVVASVVGQGTTVTLEVPLARPGSSPGQAGAQAR